MRLSDRLEDRIAIVTGAGSGIGQECAAMFARHGAMVLATDINPDALNATEQLLATEGLGFAATMPCDLTSEQSVTALADFAATRFPHVDILLNAGAFAVMKWIEDMTLADWQATLRGELDVVFLACKAFWSLLKQSGSASIINFSSANSHQALEGLPALAHCAGKGGVLAMTRQLAMEGAPHGIRANAIAPGLIVTPKTGERIAADPEFEKSVLAKHMLSRLGKPADVAWMATFLASVEAEWLTASEFAVDGGVMRW